MEDLGFFLTLQAIRRQLAATPNDLYPGPPDSLPDSAGVPWRTALDCRAVGKRGHGPLPACAQPRRLRRLCCSPTPATRMPATFSSIWITHGRRPSPPCTPTDMPPAWSCRPASLICRPRFASAPRRWNRRWQAPSANSWRQLMAAIRPALNGVTWAGSPVSPTRSPRGAHRAATPRLQQGFGLRRHAGGQVQCEAGGSSFEPHRRSHRSRDLSPA